MYYSQVGRLIKTDGETFFATNKGEKGCLIYGPYEKLLPGEYEVTFRITAGMTNRDVCCTVDVLANATEKVAESAVTGRHLASTGGTVSLAFKVSAVGKYEFRVLSTGTSDLKVAYDRRLRLTSDPSAEAQSMVVNPLKIDLPDVFKAHAGLLKGLTPHGFTFTPVSRSGRISLSAEFRDRISFLVENKEDILLLTEIFLLHGYNFDMSASAVVVDIGMNVGLTSLYFANKPNVAKVYAFEPFKRPFERAQWNFRLNPSLAAKIESRQIGLSDVDGEHTVLSLPDDTISVSVKGTSYGNPETIRTEGAARCLAPIFEEAKRAGHAIVLKVDCEGSEFAIFAELERSNMIDDVAAITCEWHKWWSPSLTQADIIDPLRRRGFIIIDRTDPADLYAGQFYAIKAALPPPSAASH